MSFRLAVLSLLAAMNVAGDTQACARCHGRETAVLSHTGMARALESGSDSAILRANPKLSAVIGKYRYEIAGDLYTVTDGSESLRLKIDWAFGQGSAGQTYLFQREGRWYETRVSYFSALRGLDLTLGAQPAAPRNILEAAGRLTTIVEAAKCFNCHATGVKKAPSLDLSLMQPGVQCERCHGSAERHVQSHAAMPKLGASSTDEISELCGQCHRTWAEIASAGPIGIQNIRFQPYRLANSKCYDPSDKRIACTSCHNPHRDLETQAAAYDAKCTACHAPGGKAVTLCKVAARDCVTCHMPQLELPGAHKKFTDHMIRVVQANTPYPN